MKPTSGDSQNESTGEQWPHTLKIKPGEFQQCYAVARLAVKLCELKKANAKENLQPQEFLGEAWKLIEKARENVSRPQSNAEYLADQHGSHEEGERVVGRILSESRIPFKKLCNAERNKGDSEMIHGVIWKVFTTERGFDDLFWTYWRETSTIRLRMIVSRSEVLGNETDKWEEYGKQMLASWKRDGVPANDLLALARFRIERDKRAENLPKKPKWKRRRATPAP